MDSTFAPHVRGSGFEPSAGKSELTPRIHYMRATSGASDDASNLALKPMGGVNRNPKQWLHKMVICNRKKKKIKKEKKSAVADSVISKQYST